MRDRLLVDSALLKIVEEHLGGKPLSLTEIFHLGEKLSRLAASACRDFDPASTQRIAVIGATTTDFLCRAIACAAAQEGILPVIYQGPFGSWAQEVLDRGSALHAFSPDLVVIAPDWRDLVEDLPIGATRERSAEAVSGKVRLFDQMWTALTETLNCRIIQHTLVPPTDRYCGIAERLAPGSTGFQTRALNTALLGEGRGRVNWVDLESLAYQIGLHRWAPSRFYYSSKLGFDQRFLPDYITVFRGAWRAAFGRAKKALVLDLDDTLWGGVIGDDGVEGIVLGAGSAAGEAFEAWQHYLKALGERGVVLAVCSRNSPGIAEQGFTHANARLRRENFAAFECTWNDKVQGLRRIAQDLNLSIDSFVFADDNPAECELIRRELPEVAVVPLGTEPSEFISLLEAGHWFDLPAYTAEDLNRAQAYVARSRANELQGQATSLGDFLRDLRMVGQLGRATGAEVERIAQLEHRTNQFNVTTRRYGESAIRSFLARKDVILLVLRLSDRFADHGLISSLIAVPEGEGLRIDSWLMSCRVFSRTAERFMLRGLISLARQIGARKLIGEYVATPRNGVVADLYASLGFSRTDAGTWRRDISEIADDDLFTEVVSADDEAH